MRTISVVVSFGLALVLALSGAVGIVAHTGVAVGGLAIAIQPAWPGLEALQERDDFAGSYLDQERGGLVVYLFTDEADDAVEMLEQHHEASRFEVRIVAYSLAELQAVQEELAARLDELRASGIDIREVAVDVSGNHVEVGASGQLAPVRAALAEYGDKVGVVKGEGAIIGPPPRLPRSVVRTADGVKVRLTLEKTPLVAGEPTWIRTKVVNIGDTPIRYTRDGCEISVGVRGEMVDQQWRAGAQADVGSIEAEVGERYRDLEWRAAKLAGADERTITLDFVPKWAIGRTMLACDSIGITRRIPPGGTVEQRLRWDGQAAGSLGPPPDGTARISGSFDFRRPGLPGDRTIEVTLEVPVVDGREPGMLHPMEAVAAALAEPEFRELIEPVLEDDRSQAYVLYNDDRDAWVVGLCGPHKRKRAYWKAVVIAALTGEVTETIDRPGGQYCRRGPWRDG